jgi:hypothetical protein
MDGLLDAVARRAAVDAVRAYARLAGTDVGPAGRDALASMVPTAVAEALAVIDGARLDPSDSEAAWRRAAMGLGSLAAVFNDDTGSAEYCALIAALDELSGFAEMAQPTWERRRRLARDEAVRRARPPLERAGRPR